MLNLEKRPSSNEHSPEPKEMNTPMYEKSQIHLFKKERERLDSGRSHSIWHYFRVGTSVSDLNVISPFLWHKEEDPWIVENEVLIANIQMSGKVSTV